MYKPYDKDRTGYEPDHYFRWKPLNQDFPAKSMLHVQIRSFPAALLTLLSAMLFIIMHITHP